jgi:NAD(P)-dependent dehydrogenase (short-subunit alcohol dehydrogenase family)
MPSNSSEHTSGTILLIAVSRGLGLAIAKEFLKKGWKVVGTVRAESGRTQLHDVADKFKEQLEVETLDICEQSRVEALKQRLLGRNFDMLLKVPIKVCAPEKSIVPWA